MVKDLSKTGKKIRPTKKLIQFYLCSRNLKYRKLPEPLLKLSVLKLDGSSFSFHVARNATVSRLKLAIEEEFSLYPNDERKKTWPLVWSHFCLCYEGQKLISEKARIRKYGIKDGDQLHFIQHLRIDLAPTPHQSENIQSIDSKECSATNVTSEDEYEEELKYLNCGEELDFPVPKSKLTHSLKQLISCSSFQHSKRKEWGRMNYR
ncbi:hypothetical protein ABFX02_09G088700 [Erythranthe guttata]